MKDSREDEDEDLHPCHEDEEFFGARPDAEEMEEAISEFMDGLEANECRCFDAMHSLLWGLPAPAQKKDSCMTHTAALEGSFLPDMDEKEQNLLQKQFTPSVLLLYKHAAESRLKAINTIT